MMSAWKSTSLTLAATLGLMVMTACGTQQQGDLQDAEAWFTLGYRAFEVDIPCDGEPHEISDAVWAVNKVETGGYTSDGGATYYAVVVHEV